LAALGKVTVTALVGIVLIVVYSVAFVVSRLEPMALGFAMVALICAGVVGRSHRPGATWGLMSALPIC